MRLPVDPDYGAFPGEKASQPEPFVNVWTNAAYALAGIPYALEGAWPAVFGLIALAFGSGVYHYRATLTTHAIDHIGIHLAFAGVIAHAVYQPTGFAAATLAYIVISVYAVLVLGVHNAIATYWKTRDLEKTHLSLTMAPSQGVIAVEGGMLVGALLVSNSPLILLVGLAFALAFVVHGKGYDTPTGFGPPHGAWHILSALGLALPAFL